MIASVVAPTLDGPRAVVRLDADGDLRIAIFVPESLRAEADEVLARAVAAADRVLNDQGLDDPGEAAFVAAREVFALAGFGVDQ